MENTRLTIRYARREDTGLILFSWEEPESIWRISLFSRSTGEKAMEKQS